jgi:hypothetical protein
MNRKLFLLGLLSIVCFSGIASAAVVTWNFAGSSGSGAFYDTYSGGVNNGKTFTSSGQSITVYGYTVDGNPTQPVNGNTGGPGYIVGSTDLFAVQQGYGGNNASGIAPYQHYVSYTSQNGITESNILLLKLDSSIQVGETLNFLLQAGVTGDAFNVWTGDFSATPTNLGKGGATGLTEVAAGVHVDNPSRNGTNPQYSFTKTVAGTQWVAIQADCHYLLLDTITGYTSEVPEPRFYGMLLVSLIGMAGIYARKRRQATVQS